MSNVKTLSQSTKDSVRISTRAFDLIVKDLQKYDSLKISYKELQSTIKVRTEQSILYFDKIQLEQDKSQKYRDKIEKQTEELFKLKQKKSNNFVYGVIGLSLGVLVTAVIFK